MYGVQNNQITYMELNLYTKQETADPDIFRNVNIDGDWTWYYIRSKDKFVKAVNYILDTGWPKGEGFKQYLLKNTAESAEKILDKAGEEGSRTHLAIDLLLKGETITLDTLLPNKLTGKPEKLLMDEWKNLLAFKSFWDKYKPRLISGERAVVGYIDGEPAYAGTLDTVIGIDNEEETEQIILLDFKTSSGIWDSYRGQVASYFKANHGLPITHTGILRLGTKHKNGVMPGAGFEFVVYTPEETEEAYRAFLSAKNLSDLSVGKTYTEKTVTIPTEIRL